MRCRNCGGMMHHFLIAEGGRNYYQCYTGLTGFEGDGGRQSRIYLCKTVQDEQSNIIPVGTNLAYISEGKAELFRVEAGKG